MTSRSPQPREFDRQFRGAQLVLLGKYQIEGAVLNIQTVAAG